MTETEQYQDPDPAEEPAVPASEEPAVVPPASTEAGQDAGKAGASGNDASGPAITGAAVGDGGPTITGGHNREILQGISTDFRASQSAAPAEPTTPAVPEQS